MDKKIYEIQDKWATKTSTGIISKGIYRNKLTGEKFFVKGNSESGYLEPASEEMAYRIGNIVGIDTLPCRVVSNDKFPEINVYGSFKFVSISPVIPYNMTQFYEYVYTVTGKEDIDYLEIYKKLGLSEEHLYKMLLLDALVGNQDRHLNNFDIYYDYKENKIKNAIMLDFGASLLYNISEADLKIYEGNKIGPDKSKPFSETHYKQMFKIKKRLDPEYTNIKIKYSLKEFEMLSSKIIEDVGKRTGMSEKRIKSLKSYVSQRYKYFFLGGFEETLNRDVNNVLNLEW